MLLTHKAFEFFGAQELCTLRKLVVQMSVHQKEGSDGWTALVLFLRSTLPKEEFLSIMRDAKEAQGGRRKMDVAT